MPTEPEHPAADPSGESAADPAADPAAKSVEAGLPPDSASPDSSPDLRGLVRRGLHPRRTASQLLVGVLCALLGFGLVAQVSATNSDTFLRTARTPDLLRLLDDLSNRQSDLNEEAARLDQARDELASGADRGQAALDESQRRAEVLGVLTGTTEATGEGVEVLVSDVGQGVTAAVLLDSIQELRDAGAEAIQVGDVRVVASTAFLDSGPGAITADGTLLSRPFRILAVGDAATMASALAIPGGVIDTVSNAGGEAIVERHEELTITAVRELPEPQYARSAPPEE